MCGQLVWHHVSRLPCGDDHLGGIAICNVVLRVNLDLEDVVNYKNSCLLLDVN